MDFEELQNELEGLRQSRDDLARKVFRDRERLKRLDVERREVGRRHRPDSGAAQTLERRAEEQSASLAGEKAKLHDVLDREGLRLEAFEPFTDPRENVSNLSDDVPILLFPLRLETRFKRVPANDGDDLHQLWVRVFPDVCSVDTFDDTLSESEVVRARTYWSERWAAGEPADVSVEGLVDDRHRGAWRKLMGLFNAGRAYWITQSYRPVNEADLPTRAAASDVLLVIPTDSPPAEPVRSPLQAYWAEHYAAAGDQARIDAAVAALAATAGTDETGTAALLKAYAPANLDETPVAQGGDVRAVFLVFPPDHDAKLVAWSQAAKVRTLPDKLVLLGYQDDLSEPVIQAVGKRIPDPVIVGPDTSDDVEAVLREAFGADVDAWTDDEKAAKYVEHLSERSDTRWLFDFDAAASMGLGFRVDITPQQYAQGFRRLMVLGVKLSAHAGAGRAALERLLRDHQFGDVGLSLIPQGTPTNNTDEGGSGYAETEDSDEAFDRYFGPAPTEDPTEPGRRHDGRQLATLLGVSPDASGLRTVAHYAGTDQVEARATHTALWNATIGYYLESMVTPVTSEGDRDRVRRFLIDHVRGRGHLPALRIGNQPYGILPISDLRNPGWLGRDGLADGRLTVRDPFLQRLYGVLAALRADFEELFDRVAHVGKSGDPHQILLEALGLHAQSVTYDRRVAESFDQIKNALHAQSIFGTEVDRLDARYRAAGMAILQRLGYRDATQPNPEISILERFFLGASEPVTKDVIDDRPLSETDAIRAYTDVGENYIEWLVRNARESHANIRDQRGFTEGKRPAAILYDMLRHAVNLEFANTGLRLHVEAGVLDEREMATARIDPDTIGVRGGITEVESRWDLIYRRDDRVAGGVLVADRISAILRADQIPASARNLQEVIGALELLQHVPTARLERCFAEHVDCCSYRLDAWLLGLLDVQLEAMREAPMPKQPAAGIAAAAVADRRDRGVYLGAYGWVEDLRPDSDSERLTPVTLDDDLAAIFDPDRAGGIVRDSSNAGYVHAPSVNHAVTAAVLRNAYISTADPVDADRYKVNLSSERVRLALDIIEGMQQGQRLGALLGYQLERTLHDETSEETDVFIYELRKLFPLSSNRLKKTAIIRDRTDASPQATARHAEEQEDFEGDQAITKVEARNVIDGLALLDHVRDVRNSHYPFGIPEGDGPGRLKHAEPGQATVIDQAVSRIANIRDAVADLALAESVHQAVQGNYDRAAGALDAYSKGGFPQLPHVVQSPGSGVSLTHRFGVHVPSSVGPGDGTTPRAKAEPGVNSWTADILPARGNIACDVRFRTPAYGDAAPGPWTTVSFTMAQLGLDPIDLLYLHGADGAKHLAGLDDHLLRAFHAAAPRRPDIEVEIDYVTTSGGATTFFEVAAIATVLRRVLVTARPLRATDVILPNDKRGDALPVSSVDPVRIGAAKTLLDDGLDDLKTGFIDVFSALLDPEDVEVGVSNAAAIRAAIDAGTTAFVSTVTDLSLFGGVQGGTGFVHQRRAAIQSAVFTSLHDRRDAWDERKARYDTLVVTDLPAAADDDQRTRILLQAEAQVSVTLTSDYVDVPDLQSKVAAKRTAFDARYVAISAFLTTEFLSLAGLFADASILVSSLAPFDLDPPSLEEPTRLLVVLAEDLLGQAAKLHASGTDRSWAVQDLLDAEAASAASAEERLTAMLEAAKLLFGEEFRVVPHFHLGADQGAELLNCWNDRSVILEHQRTDRGSDFPVDDWLYGVARVREGMAAWERVVVLAEGFRDRAPLDATPFQLPYRENDSWVALAYPESYVIDRDRLLYTAYMDGFDPDQPQCGLLVDEWTEVVPATSETTGMVFNYDQPDCEPPQSLLLAMPSEFTGAWAWPDLVRCLHEALDLARLRAVEPDVIERSSLGYGRLLPMTVATMTRLPVTMALNLTQAQEITTTLATMTQIDG